MPRKIHSQTGLTFPHGQIAFVRKSATLHLARSFHFAFSINMALHLSSFDPQKKADKKQKSGDWTVDMSSLWDGFLLLQSRLRMSKVLGISKLSLKVEICEWRLSGPLFIVINPRAHKDSHLTPMLIPRDPDSVVFIRSPQLGFRLSK